MRLIWSEPVKPFKVGHFKSLIRRDRPSAMALFLALMTVLYAGCSRRSEQKPTTKAYVLPEELTIAVHAERGPEGAGRGIHIVGSTNLPDGVKMWVQVEDGRLPPCTARVKKHDNTDYKVIIKNGQFRTIDLWDIDKPFSGGTHQVCSHAYLNRSWQTPSVLAMLGGDRGRALHGRIFKLTDPDVIDSDRKLEDLETIVFPALPPVTKTTVSPEAKAISLVKKAILTLPDRGRSAGDIETTIAWFMKASSGEIRSSTKGWSATAKTDDFYDVIFDFIDGKAGEKQALWSVNLKSREVKYVNMKAKIFSWLSPE